MDMAMLLLLLPLSVTATSFKMDFLSPRTLRPDATFRDLRDADGDTGNVEENRSLYWNPVIYKVVNPESPLTRSFEIVDTWFASAYYVFQTGETTAFPEGLKMKTGPDSAAYAEKTTLPRVSMGVSQSVRVTTIDRVKNGSPTMFW